MALEAGEGEREGEGAQRVQRVRGRGPGPGGGQRRGAVGVEPPELGCNFVEGEVAGARGQGGGRGGGGGGALLAGLEPVQVGVQGLEAVQTLGRGDGRQLVRPGLAAGLLQLGAGRVELLQQGLGRAGGEGDHAGDQVRDGGGLQHGARSGQGTLHTTLLSLTSMTVSSTKVVLYLPWNSTDRSRVTLVVYRDS